MSGISTGVGLISGINTADLIDQLMALEAKPVTTLQQRITRLSAEKAAWQSIGTSLLSLKTAATSLSVESAFQALKATSSDTTVLDAVARTTATPGTYQFTVRRLAQSHQMISTGFTNADTAPVGAGTVTLELGRGRLDRATSLSFLNGQQGIQRGSIRITDRAGTSAEINLTEAATVADVLAAINDNGSAKVRASVSGDRIVLEDTTGLGSGTLSVAEVGGGTTAAGLGLLGSTTDARLVGQDVVYLTESTSLSLLNDGTGVQRAKGTPDLEITLGDGTQLSINLLGSVVSNEGTTDYTAHTIGDVIDAINNAAGNDGRVTASLNDAGTGIRLVDVTSGGPLVVADGAGSRAATDLGIAGTFISGAVTGRALIGGLETVMLSSLDGGSGLLAGTVDLQDRSGATASVDLFGAVSVSDVIERINAAGIGIRAALNDVGNGIVLTDTTGSTTHNLVVADATGDAATKLGLAADVAADQIDGGNARLRYVSMETRLADLTPGRTFATGSFTITNSLGASATITVGASATTLGDVARLINSRGLGVEARLNDDGTGLLLEDTNAGTQKLRVAESGSQTARHLGILGESASAADGQNLIDGSMRRSITLSGTDTLNDLVKKINDLGMGVTAGVLNDGTGVNGYRLVLSSGSTGSAGRIVLDPGASGLRMTSFIEPRDALVYFGSPDSPTPIVLTSTTNQLTDALPGVTMDLQAVSDQPVTLTIASDLEGIVKKMEAFASAYNSLVKAISQYTSYDSETQQKGALFSSSSVYTVRMRLTSLVTGSANVTGNIRRLSQAGFTFGTDNELSFDAEKFRQAFASDPEGVRSFFTLFVEADEKNNVKAQTGMAKMFEQAVDSLADEYSSGLVSRVTDGLDNQTKVLNDRIEQLNQTLEAKRERLERQFAAMETALSKLQGQQSALTQLASLAAQMQGG